MYINIIYRTPAIVLSVANFKIQEEQLYTIKRIQCYQKRKYFKIQAKLRIFPLSRKAKIILLNFL